MPGAPRVPGGPGLQVHPCSSGQASGVRRITRTPHHGHEERGDGKTLIASNLAVSLSQLEKEVLIIDCDLRNPSVPWYFGHKESPGLTSVLTMRHRLDEVILKEALPFLDILPAGWAVPNPTELLSSDKFRVLLDHLRSRYHFIVMDSPPANTLVDATILAGLSDNTILVAGFRRTKKQLALSALKRILQVSNKHVYGLLNGTWDGAELQSYGASASSVTAMPTIETEAVDAKAELLRFEQTLKQRKAG